MLRPLALALGATLVLAGCGGGETPPAAGPDAGPADAGKRETNCEDVLDEDGDGKTDCDDSDCSAMLECKPVEPPSCTKQRECGDIVNEVVTNLCLEGKCVPPGPKTLHNQPLTSNIYFDMTFKTPLTNEPRPQTVVIRLVYPETLDKKPLSCAEVIGKISDNTKSCVDTTTRAVLENNPNINQVFRALYPLPNWNCSGTVCQFPNMIATVPQGNNYILYGEAWYGERDLNYPKGQCAALFCIEGKSVGTTNGQHFMLTFPDPDHP
ncbi:MAG: hypothetical protein QM765_14635 [Myxococcales bacterium]